MNAEGDDASYDPNAAAELFFAQQKARDEARSKLPTTEWIQALIRIMQAKTNIKDDDDDNECIPSMSSASFSPHEFLLSRLVTTMPPLNDSDGMIDLNTADTFISSTEETGETKIKLTSDEKVARRRIIEYLVQQLEEEMLPITTSEEEMNVDEVDQAR